MKLWKKTLSLTLCICMVLSLLPGLPLASSAAAQPPILSDGHIRANGCDLVLEAGEKPGYTKVRYGNTYVDFSSHSAYTTGNSKYEADLSNKSIETVSNSITVNGGNVEEIFGAYIYGDYHGDTNIVVNGGTVKAIIASMTPDYTQTGNAYITVNGGSVEQISGSYNDHITGDFVVTVTGGYVGSIYPVQENGTVGGDYRVKVTGGTVDVISCHRFGEEAGYSKRLYANIEGGNVRRITLSNNFNKASSSVLKVGVWGTEYYVHSLYYWPYQDITKFGASLAHALYVDKKGEWRLFKGDVDEALQGEPLVIGKDQSFTVNSNMNINTKIVNYGTCTVKDGGVLNQVENRGNMILESGSVVARVDNYGNLTSTGVLSVWNLENKGIVHFAGIPHFDTVLNNRAGGQFYCHGDHDGMLIYQDGGSFYCDSTICSKKLSGKYYGVQPLTWKGYYYDVTNEQGVPCYSREYSCTLVPQWSGMLLPKTITVHEYSGETKTLVEGVHYSWNRDTGEFKLFQGTVSYWSIGVTVNAYYPTSLDTAEVTLDQNRYLWDGTAKEPKVLSVKIGDTVLEEGKDYRFVEYHYNTEVGTAYVVLEGLGEYKNPAYIPFEIYQLELEDGYQLTLEEGNWKFTNQEIKPQTIVSKGDTVLEEGKDYTVSYTNNIKPGTATVTIEGIGQYKGTLTKEFTIGKTSIKDATIIGNTAPYNGQKQDLNIQVTYHGMTLQEDVDYVLSYSSYPLHHVGDSMDVNIQGIGDCFQGQYTFKWSIVDADLSTFTYKGIDKNGKQLYYTGYPQTPPADWYVVVENQAKEKLYVRGTWTPVTNVSDLSTFTAGGYTSFDGTMEISGAILPRPLNDNEIYIFDSVSGRSYTGQPQRAELTAYMISKEGQRYTLVEGVDYTLSGSTEATEPGIYSVTLTALSKNFSGSRTVTWEIAPVDISGLEIVGDTAPSLTYTGKSQTPDTKVFYTLTDGTVVEVPGSWSALTNVADTTTFTAASKYFTGSVTLENVVQPLDISDLSLELNETTGVYDGDKHWPYPQLEGFDYFDYDLTWDVEPIDVGTYTATITGTKNFTGSVTRTYEVTPASLSVVLWLDYKVYDGTTDVTVLETGLEGARYGDDLILDDTNLAVTLPSANAGYRPTAAVSGLTLSGEDAKNYTYDLTIASLKNDSSTFYIEPCLVQISAEDQEVPAGEELDQSKWYVNEETPLPEGFTLSDVLLTVNDSTGEIIPSGGIITNEAGKDVTMNFSMNYFSGNLTLICSNHVCDEYGFCDNCGGYQMPEIDTGEDPEWDYDNTYLVYNAGQLFWTADYVNKVLNEINIKLMADITIPTGKQWVPFLNFYGTFDGNFKTVSGIHLKSEDQWVGFFGGGSYSYGTIKNLRLSNSTFEGDYTVGAIAGYHAGTIENCFVDDTVTVKGNNYVGALVGDFDGSMFNCYAYASELVGYSNYGYLENCYYLSETETEDGGKTAEQFASGEVAYLLQSAILGEEIYDEDWNWIGTAEPELIWGQTIGQDDYPVLGGQEVYCVTNCQGEPAYSNTDLEGVHSYVNGTCSLCGAADPSQPPISLNYLTLSFKDEILMNVYFALNGLDDVVEMGLITYDSQVESWNIHNAQQVVSGYKYYPRENLYIVTTNGISAKNMGDRLWFAVYTKLSDGSYTYSKLVNYSPKDYADTMLGQYNEALDRLLVSMLNYGAAAQLYFGYNTENLVNRDLTDAQKAMVSDYNSNMIGVMPTVPAEKQGAFASNKGFSQLSPSVSFKGALAINYYCTPVAEPVGDVTLYYWDEAAYAANPELTAQNATGCVEMTHNANGQYTASVTGIPARKMNSVVYVAFCYSDGNTDYSSGILPYSIGEYCRYYADVNHEFTNMAKATAVYGFYAKEYFG